MGEARTLDANLIRSHLFLDRDIDEPLVGLDAKISPLQQIRDEKTASSQGATPEIQQVMLLSKTEGVEQAKLRRRHQVVLPRWSDVGTIMSSTRRQIEMVL